MNIGSCPQKDPSRTDGMLAAPLGIMHSNLGPINQYGEEMRVGTHMTPKIQQIQVINKKLLRKLIGKGSDILRVSVSDRNSTHNLRSTYPSKVNMACLEWGIL